MGGKNCDLFYFQVVPAVMKMIPSKQWTEIFDQIPGLSWHRLLWWSDTQLFTKIGAPRSSLQSCSWWWAKPWWWCRGGDNDDEGCSLYQTSFHFHNNPDCKKNRFQHCFKAAWRSPIKIHCEKSLSTTSNYCLSSSLFQSYYIVIILAIFSWNVLHFVFLRFLPPRIFLFVPLFIFHICRLTCAIFFTKFPTSNWSQCAAICIVVHTTTFPTKYCTEYSTHSSADFYKIFYGSGPMHCNEESDRCISRPSDNGHL